MTDIYCARATQFIPPKNPRKLFQGRTLDVYSLERRAARAHRV